MNKKTVLDKGYFIATILNIFFLLGLIFISRLENLYINSVCHCDGNKSVYLVVKAVKINENKSSV